MIYEFSKRRIAPMMICIAVVLGPSANAQDILGQFLGPVIEAGAGEVLNRAGGQILEGALNGRGGRRQLPTSRRRPFRRSDGGQRVPMRSAPSSPDYSQPTRIYSEPIPSESLPSSRVPGAIVTPALPNEAPGQSQVAPPANEIPIARLLHPNATPLDLALKHVLEDGPSLAARVLQAEATGVLQILDDAIVKQLRRDEPVDSVISEYRAATENVDSLAKRKEWNATHSKVVAASNGGIEFAVDAAVSASRLSSAAGALTFAERQDLVDELRDHLATIPTSMIGSDDLSLLAERVRNMRNISLLAELARLTGVERRQDLFPRIQHAVSKSHAPSEFVALISGFALPGETPPVPHASISTVEPLVALHNPLTSQAPVHFTIENVGQLTLDPGATAAGDQSVIVRFDNGKGETKRYTLEEGLFQWGIKNGEWDIKKKTVIKFVVDASLSRLPFHYLVDGEAMLVEPGEIAEHTSAMPPRIDFDRGLGDGSFATKILNSGRFAVMVDPNTGAFDLYPDLDDSVGNAGTTRQRALQAWRASIAQTQSRRQSEPSDAVGQTLDSILDEIE